MKKKTQSCPECGGTMTHGAKTRTIRYRDLEDHVRVTGWWCDSCQEGIVTGDDLRKYSRALQNLKAKADDVLAPAEVAVIRQKLGLSQRQAGEVLGGGPRAFQKYETGTQTPSVPMSQLLRLLANDPKRLGEILAKTKGELSTRKAQPKRGSGASKHAAG